MRYTNILRTKTEMKKAYKIKPSDLDWCFFCISSYTKI